MRFAKPVLVVSVVVAPVIAVASISSSNENLDEVIVRGEVVDPTTFSLTELHTAQQKRAFDDAHAANMTSCMTDRGFESEPISLDSLLQGRDVEEVREEYPDLDPDEVTAYAEAYGEAAIGTGTETVVVTVAGSEIADPGVPISGSWTDETCFWQSYEAMGTDPFTFTGLRLLMNALTDSAESSTVEDSRLDDVFAGWTDCAGLSAEALLGELTATSLGAEDPQHDCVADTDLALVAKVRGEYHVAAAAANQTLVTQWVETLDRALASLPAT
ncbi:MAG: hypothetical protein R2707_21145 [Acidimicrobiales bacterium]